MKYIVKDEEYVNMKENLIDLLNSDDRMNGIVLLEFIEGYWNYELIKEFVTQANSIKKLSLTIAKQVGEEDKMFGSVTNLDIHKSLTEKDIKVERQSILLDQPIKELGVHNVPIKLSSGQKQEIKVYVIKG